MAASKILDLSLPVDNFPCDLVGVLNDGFFSEVTQWILLQIGGGHDDEKFEPGNEDIIGIQFAHVRRRGTK